MWHQDLAPFAALGPDCAASLRAVGWLERGKAFATGLVDAVVYERLVDLLKHPWEPVVAMGFHQCDLCQYDGPSGKRTLYVPADGIVYVCPELITHYMNAHAYRPPDVFCDAVLACPEMRSMPYLKAVVSVSRQLARHAK